MAFVQAKSAYSTGQVTHIHLTLNSATTAGNAVFVLSITYATEAAANGQVTGTGTYTLDIGSGGNNRGMHSQLNIAGDVGEITYTPTNTSYLAIAAAEFSGIATSSAFVSASSKIEIGGSGTSFDISTASDTSDACLIIGGGKDATTGRTHTAGGDTTLAVDIAAGGYQGGVLVYEIQSSPGAATLNWTSSGTDAFSEILACYKLAAGGGDKTVNLTESGSGADSIGPASVVASMQDAGSGADSFPTRQAALPSIADSGTFSDILQAVRAAMTILETGSGVDAPGFAGVVLTVADTATAADVISQLTASLSLVDTGTGTDTAVGLILISIAETGTGTDALTSVSVTLGISETGTAADLINPIQVVFTLADAGTGTDLISVSLPGFVSILDSMLGTDSIGPAVVTAGLSDTGTGLEAPTVLVTLPTISDIGSALDSILKSLLISLTDAGAATDAIQSISVLVPIAESGIGTDLAGVLTAVLSILDVGAGTDVAVNITLLGDYTKLKVTFSGKAARLNMTGRQAGLTFKGKKPKVEVN